jgi:hypothetical protein
MNPDPQSSSKSLLKRPTFYTFLILIAAAVYVSFVLFSRHQSNRAFEKRAAEKAAEQRRADDRAALDELGGTEFAIRALYLSPPIIHLGESAQLCYDVSNAKSVTLDPPEGEVWPSHDRCLDLSPKKSTTYTLTISNASGQSLSQSVQLQVR